MADLQEEHAGAATSIGGATSACGPVGREKKHREIWALTEETALFDALQARDFGNCARIRVSCATARLSGAACLQEMKEFRGRVDYRILSARIRTKDERQARHLFLRRYGNPRYAALVVLGSGHDCRNLPFATRIPFPRLVALDPWVFQAPREHGEQGTATCWHDCVLIQPRRRASRGPVVVVSTPQAPGWRAAAKGQGVHR